MTVWVQQSEKSGVYHLSPNCPMPRIYGSQGQKGDAYKPVPKPPPGFRPCRRNGACQA